MGKSDRKNPKSVLLRNLQIDRQEKINSTDSETVGARPLIKFIIGILFATGFVSGWLYFNKATELSLEPITESGQNSNNILLAGDISLITKSERQVVSPSATLLDASGYVTARRQATVSSKITGKIIAVLVEEGDSVLKDQLLARLDSDIIKAQYHLNQSQHIAVKSELLELDVQRRKAQLHLERVQLLAQQSLISMADLDNAELALEGVLARIQRTNKEISVAESRVRLMEQQLLDTEIRAPFAGVVINKAAQPGEIISPVSAGGGFTRTGICSLVDMNSLEIEVDVSESNITRVFPGQSVLATLNSYRDWKIPAEVITIIPTADRSKATVKVRIKFLQSDHRILPDMGVKVSFLNIKSNIKNLTENQESQ